MGRLAGPTSRRSGASWAHRSDRLRYHAFDLLALEGYDLRQVPYVQRKQLLQELLAGAPGSLIYVEYLEADGAQAFRNACELGLEGLVAKRRDSPYRSGRSESWIKLKCIRSDTFPIMAFVEKLGAKPRRIASLYIGRYDGDQLLYAGKAQSGYSLDDAIEVRERLHPFIRKDTPLSVPVRKPKATWVEPVVEAEIEYAGMTDDGLLRAPVLRTPGRFDRRAHAASALPRPLPRKGRGGVPRENILQLLPDAVVPSKPELEAYWRKVGKRALHYLGRRPLKLVRHTRGTTFYHKGTLPPRPPSVHELHIEKRESGGGVRVWVDDVDGLLGLVAMDAVELHPWAATVDDIERPDRLIFDLDPGEGVAWAFVVQRVERIDPDRFTLNADPALQTGRIFLDYLAQWPRKHRDWGLFAQGATRLPGGGPGHVGGDRGRDCARRILHRTAASARLNSPVSQSRAAASRRRAAKASAVASSGTRLKPVLSTTRPSTVTGT